MTTGITTISQDSFSRIDALLARARETTEAKRTSRDATGVQSPSAATAGGSASVVQGAEAPVQAAEADQAYTAVMDMLSSPSGDVHNSLDPDRVARLLGL